MSETASFVDPVFLARFGLARVNVLDYFLHPLNPFRTKATTSNEVLSMQGISIGMLMQYGIGLGGGGPEPMTAFQAEEEYNAALKRLTGEQYQLMPPVRSPDGPPMAQLYAQPSQLYVIRHIVRTSPTALKVIGVYYVVEGIIYKSPAVRSVCKANVARTLHGLSAASGALSVCARYLPSTGYTWVFEDALRSDANDDHDENDDKLDFANTGGEGDEEDSDIEDGEQDDVAVDANSDKKRKKGCTLSSSRHQGMDPVKLYQLWKKRKRRKVLDHRRPGERTAAEEEGIRASESIDQILVRISRMPAATSFK